ncbi:hypothetical protein B1R32_103188 [Abditibacterium utsteinense]|uniref:Glycoside hydrolase family 42 N-terminal domain-containing protein n=1 Tax=Abditibacterium utsteinense TaxID=1960156 RepID=A0A2S8SVV2_9BACT|nr:hypothetical protein [Abditibacterium utsteinense]PQV64921.1 hypothetical protein B1R32_103188 [Abditibacterium utsteinense]
MSKFPHFLLAGALFCSTPFLVPLRAQTPLASSNSRNPARVLGAPGVRREAGAWLFNGSIFVAPGENLGAPGGPVFMSNLRRDKKNKLPLFLPASTRAPLNWATLPLPDFRTLSAPGFDFAALQLQLITRFGAARAQGRVYVGWSLPMGQLSNGVALPPLQKDAATTILKRLRAVLDAVAPDSALVVEVETARNPLGCALDLDALAPSCDAVLLRVNGENSGDFWPLKMARRNAEEQKDFDLPIFVAPSAADNSTPISESRWLEFFMGGATGFVLPDAQTPSWAGAVARNSGLFTGAVTLEDAAVLPSLNPQTFRLVAQLRAAGRVPLVGRLPADDGRGAKNGESLFAILDDQTSLETLNGLDKAARAGNTLYLEGAPNLKNPALLTKMSDMTSTTIEILPTTKNEVLTLSDPWMFGSVRGREIGVTQHLKWTTKTSLAAQTRKKKGEDLLEPFSAAKLANDENGLLIAPLGKGRIVWLAHTPVGAPADEAARRSFYAAMAGNLQGALASFGFDSLEENIRNGGAVYLALRASKTGTPIVALFNEGGSDAKISLSARSDAPVAIDLSTDREIAATVSGYSSNVKVTVPARGFVWLAFGATRAALDKERLALRPKARTMK